VPAHVAASLRLGLTSARWQILGAIVAAERPQPVAWLARNLGANRQNVQRIINDLHKEGLVAFEPHPHHRRAQLVVLTDKGRQRFDAAMRFVDYATARSHIAAGTLKAVGVAALTPRPELPGVPPVAAVPGLGGFEAWPWQGFVLRAKTPEAVIAKLRDIYVAAVADPVVRQKVSDAGAELLQSSPQEMADRMRKEELSGLR
jgi:DNA-binding MarR family transcriptional regulator